MQGTKPNHCSSTVKSTDEAFCHLRKAWFFGSINTFMLYQQILRLFSLFGNFLEKVSFLELLSHDCMYTIRINFQVTQSSSSDGRPIFHGRNLLIFTSVSSEFEQFSFLKYFCLITKQQITWFIVWELIWQWGKTQIYQEKCISRDKFWLIVKAEKCTAS